MESVFSTTLPVFSLILLGFSLSKSGVISPQGTSGLVAFVFYVAVPALVFRSSNTALTLQSLEIEMMVLYYGCHLSLFFLALFFAKHGFACNAQESAIFAMGAIFSNVILVGLPLIKASFGDEGVIALMTIVVIHTLVFYTLPSVLIEASNSGKLRLIEVVSCILSTVVKNPIIMAILLGVVWSSSQLAMPSYIDNMTRLLANAATPCALFVVGASVAQFKLSGNIRLVAVMVFVKLVIAPVAVWFIGFYWTSLSPLWLAVAIVTAAMPIGANVFLLSGRYQVLTGESSSAIALSTLLSAFSLSLVLYFLPVAR